MVTGISSLFVLLQNSSLNVASQVVTGMRQRLGEHVEIIQKYGVPTADLSNATSSVENGSWRSEKPGSALVHGAGSVMKPADKDNPTASKTIQVQSAEVARIRQRMAKLFPELVRSQQQGNWCVSRSLLVGNPAAAE